MVDYPYVLDVSRAKDPFQRARDQLRFELAKFDLNNVMIWGAGENGRFAAELLNGLDYRLIGFYDANVSGEIGGVPVSREPQKTPIDTVVIIAMNGPHRRIQEIKKICEKSKTPCMRVVNYMRESDSDEAPFSKSLSDYAGAHKGERCFVVGNGPSLNQIEMPRLKGEICLGSNRCFVGFEKWGFRFPYWGVVDQAVGGWQADGWKALRGLVKFIPTDMLFHVDADDPSVCPVNFQRAIEYKTSPPLFSVYPEIVFAGRSVTYLLLQIAAIMGCDPIYLIGVDFAFTTDGVNVEPDGDIWRQVTNDKNHFDPNYIPAGRFLHKPHWDLQRLAFQSALNAGRLHGFRIFNATPNSKLDLFESVAFESLF